MNRDQLTNLSRLTVAALLFTCPCQSKLFAQAGLRESFQRMDKNQDGEISPDEITPLARPYLERITRSRRMSLERPNDIDRLMDAARIYFALKNGVSGRDVRPEGEDRRRDFGVGREEYIVPEFGLPKMKLRYMQEDVDESFSTMRRYDSNKDGFIDREEARRNRWTHRNPWLDDLDKDGRLSRMELVMRYARRRMLEESSEQVWQKARRTGGLLPRSRRTERTSESERSRQRSRESRSFSRNGGTNTWLTITLLGRFDANRNGKLEAGESKNLGLPLSQIDKDRNNEITREELHEYMLGMQKAAGETVAGLPAWFYELDQNRDQQIAMSEFTEEWTAAKFREFNQLDSNRDGLITTNEAINSKIAMGGTFANEKAEVLPPRKTIVSEIEVPDEIMIEDLNVQLSITHTYVGNLDCYLTGPNGDRIELFTEIGGSGDHFEKTIFDDQGRYPITKARSPFRGSYIPEGATKKQPGLSHFKGKSAKGVWQLVIRGSRSERFGMLHDWRLVFKSGEDLQTTSVIASAMEQREKRKEEENEAFGKSGVAPQGTSSRGGTESRSRSRGGSDNSSEKERWIREREAKLRAKMEKKFDKSREKEKGRGGDEERKRGDDERTSNGKDERKRGNEDERKRGNEDERRRGGDDERKRRYEEERRKRAEEVRRRRENGGRRDRDERRQ